MITHIRKVSLVALVIVLFTGMSGTALAAKRMPTVKEVTVTVLQTNKVRVSWTKRNVAKSYVVRIKKGKNVLQRVATKKSRRNFISSLFREGKTYKAQVRVKKTKKRKASKWKTTSFVYEYPDADPDDDANPDDVVPGDDADDDGGSIDDEYIMDGPARGEGNNDSDQIFKSLTVSPSDSGTVFIGGEGTGFFKTTDAGSTWTRLRAGLKVFEGSAPEYTEVWDMAIDPNNESNVYAATLDGPGPPMVNTVGSSGIGGPYKTANAGATWLRSTTGLENSYTTTVEIDPSDSDIIYIGTGSGDTEFDEYGGGLYRSTDAGLNWTEIYDPLATPNNMYRDLLFRGSTMYVTGVKWPLERGPASEYTLSNTGSIGLIKSTDAGAHWTSINPGDAWINSFDVSQSNPDIIYAHHQDTFYIYKSVDGGANWTQKNVNINGPLQIHPTNPDIVIFAASGTVYRTIDGGESATELFTHAGNITDIEFAPSDPTIVYAAGTGLTAYRSTDSGATFTEFVNLRDEVMGVD